MRSLIAEAIDCVVIDHSGRLHEGVTDRGANKVEASLLQIFAHGVGFRSASREFLSSPPPIHARLAADKLPDVAVKTSKFFLNRQEGFGILDRRIDLETIADNSLISQQLPLFSGIIFRYFFRIEAAESRPIILPLAQNRVPTKAGLRSLKNQKFEKHAIVMLGDTPLFIVVGDGEFIARPLATPQFWGALNGGLVQFALRLMESSRPAYPFMLDFQTIRY